MGHTWETLRAIEQCVNNLQDTSHAWQVRVELTQCVANCRTIRGRGGDSTFPFPFDTGGQPEEFAFV